MGLSGLDRFLLRCLMWAVVCVILYFVLGAILFTLFPFFRHDEATVHVMGGWFAHSRRVCSSLTWEALVAIPIVLATVVACIHYVMLNLPAVKIWRWKNSLVLGLAFSFFTGAVAAVAGGAAQIYELSHQPMTQRLGSSSSPERSMYHLFGRLMEYEAVHEKSPSSIEELFEDTSYGWDYATSMEPVLRKGDSIVYYGGALFREELRLIAHTTSPGYDGGWLCLMSDGGTKVVKDLTELKLMIEKSKAYVLSEAAQTDLGVEENRDFEKEVENE